MKQNLSIQTFGQRQRLLEWSKKVADCRQSGMSVKRWCTENGTTPKTYYSWQKKVFEAMVEQQQLQLESTSTSNDACFAELPPAQVMQKTPEIMATVRIGNAVVDFYSGADPAVVAAICQGMK